MKLYIMISRVFLFTTGKEKYLLSQLGRKIGSLEQELWGG